MLEKAATIKRFEYSPLGSENKLTSKKNKYQGLEKAYEFNKTVVNKKHKNSDQLHNNSNFNTFNISDEEFNELSNETKYKHLQKFFNRINELRKVKSRTEDIKKEKLL